MDELQILAELRKCLADADAQTWDLVERLGSSLEGDPRHSDYERTLVQRLRSGVTDLIAAKRDGFNLHTTNASVAITALETSIKKRTTGADGWPMR